jgi:ribosomal protein L11 methylase PrmA
VVAEVGTGSGVLALSAARAGACKVIALDINPVAVTAADQNANANGLSHLVEHAFPISLLVLPRMSSLMQSSVARHRSQVRRGIWRTERGTPDQDIEICGRNLHRLSST